MNEPRKQVTAAVREGNLEVVRQLLTQFPEFAEESGGFWLITALRAGHVAVAKLLLDLGVDVDAYPIIATTPLASAAAGGEIEIAKWLIAHGASLERPAIITDDPLLKAVSNEQLAMMEYLISVGYDPHYEFEDGTTALSYAQLFGKGAALELMGGQLAPPKPHIKTSLPDFTGTKMSSEMLTAIEQALGVKIPDHLRTFLLEGFPSELYYANAPDADDSWTWHSPDYGMLHTVRSYIAYNVMDRCNPPFNRMYDNYLVIGTNGGGDMWCVDTTGANEEVHVYEHELDQFSSLGVSLNEHARELIEQGFGRED